MDVNVRPRKAMLSLERRLEGVVLEKTRGAIEQPRYLVMDLKYGSISLYKKSPPNPSMSPSQRSPLRKRTSSIRLKRSRSFSDDSIEVDAPLISLDNLTHLSTEKRENEAGWDPIFTLPFSADWKIRDVENDELKFHLVIPSEFKTVNSEAVNLTMVGGSEAYCSPDNDNTTSFDSMDLVSELQAPLNKRSMFQRSMTLKSFKRDKSTKQDTILTLKVMLDGNEKHIWLTAAMEMNRLAASCAVSFIDSKSFRSQTFKAPQKVKNQIALQYAQWARMVDHDKRVIDFDPRKGVLVSLSDDELDTVFDDDTRLVKMKPEYAYKNRMLMSKDVEHEYLRPSVYWDDFRKETVEDRDDPVIGSLHVEVMSCHGLPKLDTFSLTDAVVYVVCGPFAFTTDVIDSAIHPAWPAKSRRACIFPLYFAYQKLFVGVFDDDGPNSCDDFAGRVVIDVSSIRPTTSYDVFLPLRRYQNVYVKEARGVIRLRLRIEWNNERKALLSHLRRPKKLANLGNAITLNCSDLKAFRNAILTVQGEDAPGKFKPIIQKGLQREMALYQTCLMNGMIEFVNDVIFWVQPWTSGCIFLAWMHCVYTNSLAYVPVYFLIGINVLMYNNHQAFVENDEHTFGFTPPTLPELLKCLFFGGDTTKYLKPAQIDKHDAILNSRLFRQQSVRNLNVTQNPVEFVIQNSTFRIDDDHVEFPFSEKGRYPQSTLAEACSGAKKVLVKKNESGSVNSALSSVKKLKKKHSAAKKGDEEDEDEETDEFLRTPNISSGRFVKKASTMVNHRVTGDESSTEQDPNVPERIASFGSFSESETEENVCAHNELEAESKIWKRKGQLPEQNAEVKVKFEKKKKMSLKQELLDKKNLMHKVTNRLFDDQLFIADENTPSGEELALETALGMNSQKNPIMAKVAELLSPALDMFKIGLSIFRAGFNLFTYRDPYLSFLFQIGLTILMCVLVVFPWRLFFFVIGFGLVGPQNYFAKDFLDKKKTEDKATHQDSQKTNGTSKPKEVTLSTNACVSSAIPFEVSRSNHFRFHNHLLTDGGIDLRQDNKNSSGKVYRAVVPNSPLISRRFYDWPPNPSLSHALIIEENREKHLQVR